MKIKNKNPSFVKIFKNLDAAKNACSILIFLKNLGFSNKKIMHTDFFRNLFAESYLTNSSNLQLEWRLKNMARDLKNISFDDLEHSWHEYKIYFEGTRRKLLNEEKTEISV